jgi:DNA-binding NtrC family response regulator
MLRYNLSYWKVHKSNNLMEGGISPMTDSKPMVMLVDDEEEFVETLKERLEVRGLVVFNANSGKEALEVLDKHRNTDVVILDVKMPEMDGIETLRQIKSRFPLMEVLMLTGHATIDTAIEGMKLGAYDYLMKPCDIESLMAKVQAATDKKRDHERRIREAQVKAAITDYGLE